jgi:hypothetical protein
MENKKDNTMCHAQYGDSKRKREKLKRREPTKKETR